MSKPKYIARATVVKSEDGKDDIVRTIGAAFPFNKGDGYVVNLNTVPTNWDGSFILVTPQEEKPSD